MGSVESTHRSNVNQHKQMPTILIIEDEPQLVKVLRSYLEDSGFDTLSAYRGDTGLSVWEHKHPDLVILDLNLPGLDGLDVAREIRRKADTPILMLTARVEETDQLIGLELGADDYITKPFSPRIVIARVRALLRRSSAKLVQPKVIRAADLVIDKNAYTVIRAGERIMLTQTEFGLLYTLASQPGRAFKRSELLEAALDTNYEGYDRNIDAHVKNIRAKIEENPKSPRYIETVYGIGYRFTKE